MTKTQKNQIDKAIAYLKIDIFDKDVECVTLQEKGEPILLQMGDFLMSFLIDRGEIYYYIQRRDIDTEGITVEELAEIGVENLRKLANEHLQVNVNKGVYSAILDGNFEASLVFLDGLWDVALQSLVRNKFIITIPARDVLAFCDSEDEDGLNQLKDICKRVWDNPESDHLLSNCLYIREDDKWREYQASIS